MKRTAFASCSEHGYESSMGVRARSMNFGPMIAEDLELLRYPTGKFARGAKAETPARRAACIAVIEAFPERLHRELQGLNNAQLDTPYRPGGWTVRQLVHHIADSHAQTIIRFKL